MAEPTFQNIPSDLYVPGFFVEFTTLSDEIPTDDVEPVLLFTPMLATGTATPNVPTRVVTSDQARGLLGRGSIGHRMVEKFRINNALKELWIIPVADDGGATKAVWTFYVPDDATVAGNVCLYIGGQLVKVGVAADDLAEDIATALKEKIEDSPDLVVEYVTSSLIVNGSTFTTTHASETFTTPAPHGWAIGTKIRFIAGTGTLPTGVVEGTDYYVLTIPTDSTFTISETAGGATHSISADASGAVRVEAVPVFKIRSRNGGTLNNNLNIQLNYKDSAAGEFLPGDVTVTWSQTTAGATDPTLTTAIAALGDEGYDYIGMPWLDALDDLATEMTARWNYDRLLYGHVWAVKRDSAANLITYGDTRNGKDETVFGIEDFPNPDFEVLGAVLGQMSLALDDDPALPEQTLVLSGILSPKRGATGRWKMATRNAVLASGIATLKAERGSQVTIERSRNTYKTDMNDDTDKTYRDIQSRFIPMRSTRYLSRVVNTKFRRKRLVNDNNVLPMDGRTTAPKVALREFQAAYGELVEIGWLTNINHFKERASAQIDPNDTSRMNILFANELAKQLRIVAMSNESTL